MIIIYIIISTLLLTAVIWKFLIQCLSGISLIIILVSGLIMNFHWFLAITAIILLLNWQKLKKCPKKTTTLTILIIWIILIKAPPLVLNYLDIVKLNPYNKVITALEKYKAEKNEYPETLQELIPNYIEELPPIPKIDFLSEVYYTKDPVKFKKYGLKFLNDNHPQFLLKFLGSGGVLFPMTNIIYCPVTYSCEYEGEVSKKIGNNVILEKQTIVPERINNTWIYIVD